MNASSFASFSRALVFAAGCTVLSAQIGHAQGNLPPVTGVQPQPSRLVAADNCCRSGLAQIVVMLPAAQVNQGNNPPTQINYGSGGWVSLERFWLDHRYRQQRIIRTKLGDIALIPLLSSPSFPPALSVSVDPHSKLLKVFFRVSGNRIKRLTHTCGTFDLEVAMVFEVTSAVAVRSSDVNSSNFVPTGGCNNVQSIGDRLNSEVFADAGIAMKLANRFNASLRYAAKDHGIRAVTPGVRPENNQMLVFEIAPVVVAVPTGDVQ